MIALIGKFLRRESYAVIKTVREQKDTVENFYKIAIDGTGKTAQEIFEEIEDTVERLNLDVRKISFFVSGVAEDKISEVFNLIHSLIHRK